MKARVIGMMSGSSLDGLDIADCTFNLENNTYFYSINSSNTLVYPNNLKKAMLISAKMSEQELTDLNKKYSHWVSDALNKQIKNASGIQLLGLHGHTVFHEPEKGYSFQLGDGEIIYSNTSIPTVTDFRNADIKAGGQGAPLTPKGDLDLFPEFDGFLNLGGISNFSVKIEGRSILGFDICPFNLPLNHLAGFKGFEYDKNGFLASNGQIIQDLYLELNAIPFYQIKEPKSIDRLWYEDKFLPILNKYLDSSKLEDILHTTILHQSFQISTILNHYFSKEEKVLITGGGAFNGYFIDLLKSKVKSQLIIPDPKIVEYKEALIFAYLALLRALDKPNCIGKVTGAKINSIGGKLDGKLKLNTN